MKIQFKLYADDGRKLQHVTVELKPMSVEQAEDLVAALTLKARLEEPDDETR